MRRCLGRLCAGARESCEPADEPAAESAGVPGDSADEPAAESKEVADTYGEYVDKSTLIKLLKEKGRPVRLVKPQFLIDQFEKSSEPLPCRQDLPEEAFLDVESLSQDVLDDLSIVVVSYCWLSRSHPDPQRYHLETLAALFKIYLAGDRTYGMPELKRHNEEMGFDVGGRGRTVGIFLDWTGLYQEQGRTAEQTQLFQGALRNINTWYAHADTLVFKLTSMPEGTERTGVKLDGEHLCADEVLKAVRFKAAHSRRFRFINLLGCKAELPARTLVGAVGELAGRAEGLETLTLRRCEGIGGRLSDIAPLTSLKCLGLDNTGITGELANLVAFASLQQLRLSDCAGVTGELRDLAALTGLQQLHFDRCQAIAGELAGLAPLASLRELNLSGSSTAITGELSGLAPLTALQRLNLCECAAIAGELGGLAALTSLQTLNLSGSTGIAGELRGLAPLTSLRELYLNGCAGINGELRGLAPLTGLQVLSLIRSTGVSGELGGLAPLTSLQELRLNDCSLITGELGGLASLTALWSLNCSGCTGLTGELGGLAPLTGLKVLNLSDCTGIAGDLGGLAPLTSLMWLTLTGCEGVAGELPDLPSLQEASLPRSGASASQGL